MIVRRTRAIEMRGSYPGVTAVGPVININGRRHLRILPYGAEAPLTMTAARENTRT